jgi:hypothetical protein
MPERILQTSDKQFDYGLWRREFAPGPVAPRLAGFRRNSAPDKRLENARTTVIRPVASNSRFDFEGELGIVN